MPRGSALQMHEVEAIAAHAKRTHGAHQEAINHVAFQNSLSQTRIFTAEVQNILNESVLPGDSGMNYGFNDDNAGQHSLEYDPPQQTVSASTVGSRAIASARQSASSVEGKFHGHAIPRKNSIYDASNNDSGSEERVARRPEVVTTQLGGSTTTTTLPTSPLKMNKAISDEYNLDRTNSFLDSVKPQNQLLLRCAMMPCDVDDDESKTSRVREAKSSVREGSLEYAYDFCGIIPVLHTFYNKALRENDDGSVNLVGTMWTTVMFDQRGLEESKDRNAANAVNRLAFPAGTGAQSSAQTKHRNKFAEAWGFHGEFPIRINDRLARSPHQSHGSSGLNTHAISLDQWDPNYISQDGQMFTYHCNIPMKKSYVYDMPPYQIVRFTVEVDLGTITFQDTHPNGEKGNYTCRPDLLVNEKLNNFVFTKSQPSSKPNGKGEDMNAMNDMDSYFLVTPVPHVQLRYNKYRGCTQSYEIEYYCTGSFRHKFVATLFPLIYVATLTTISVFNPDDEWGGPNLENSIGLALTVVFILPELRPAGGDHDFSANDISIMLLFLGHIMAGIAHPNLDDPANPGFIASGFNSTFAPETYGWIGMAGIACVWIATLIIPLYNGLRYVWILHKIKAIKLPKDVKEAAKVANKEWVGPRRDTPKAHTGSVQEPSVHPDRPFSQSSLASGQQGGQFSSSVQSHMHANAYLKMCIHPRCTNKRMRVPEGDDAKRQAVLESSYPRYKFTGKARDGTHYKYKLHPLCEDHFNFMIQSEESVEKRTCERMCRLSRNIYRKSSIGSITSTGDTKLREGKSEFGEWKVNNTTIFKTEDNALEDNHAAGYITLEQGPSYNA